MDTGRSLNWHPKSRSCEPILLLEISTHVHGLVISLRYPSTPGHLCLILSLLRVSCPDDSTQGHAWINSQTTLASPPGLIILTEPSAYFLPETSDNPVKPLYVFTSPCLSKAVTSVGELQPFQPIST
jgi:hypothetical protein